MMNEELKYNVPSGDSGESTIPPVFNISGDGVAISFHSSENCPYKKILDKVSEFIKENEKFDYDEKIGLIPLLKEILEEMP